MKPLLTAILLSVAITTTAFAAWPINDTCPVDQKTARPIYRVKTNDGMVAFCCSTCMQAFSRSPGKYTVKRKAE
jgi:YHS domain-containing protein